MWRFAIVFDQIPLEGRWEEFQLTQDEKLSLLYDY